MGSDGDDCCWHVCEERLVPLTHMPGFICRSFRPENSMDYIWIYCGRHDRISCGRTLVSVAERRELAFALGGVAAT